MVSEHKRKNLPNGLGVVLAHMPHAASASVGVWARAGGRYERLEQAGISHFVEHLVFKGTRRRSCEQLKQEIEGIGGALNGFTAEEFTCYMAKVPKRYVRRAIDVLSDMVRNPVMAKSDVEKEREVILEEIRMYEDSPGQLVHDLFSQLLWPNHPLGTLLSGTLDTVRGLRRREIVEYWKKMYQPRGVLVSCAGAFDADSVDRYVGASFGTMRARPLRRFSRAPRIRRGINVRVWKKETEQAHLCVGSYAIPRMHPGRFALELAHVVLGANMSSRLFREVREKRGLVYEIGTHIKRFDDTGAFIISAGCDPSKLRATVETICKEVHRLRRVPVSKAELKRAKEYYAGQLTMGLEDTMDHMLWMGEQAVSVGRIANPKALLDRLGKVSAQDIKRVARKVFTDQRLRLAVVGPVAESESSRLGRLCSVE